MLLESLTVSEPPPGGDIYGEERLQKIKPLVQLRSHCWLDGSREESWRSRGKLPQLQDGIL